MESEQEVMLQYWQSTVPDISPEELAGNLVRRFKLPKDTAKLVIAARMRNEEHTKQIGG